MNVKNYNPLSWIIGFFHIPKKSVFAKLKSFIICILVYTSIITFLDYKYDIITGTNNIGQFHLLFSFCLSIIVAFRINVAYSRWWEGRGHWGSLVNNSRNLAIKFHNFIGLANDSEFKNYVAFFPELLKNHLRYDLSKCSEIVDQLGIKHTYEYHLPNLVLHHMYRKINQYRLNGVLSFEQYLAIEKHVETLTDIMGACEKILKTPVPTGFSIFTRFALMFYMIIFPFGWVDHFGFLIAPILIVIIYVLLGLEALAEEMEEPFGTDYNDLPLDNIAQSIHKNIEQIALFNQDPLTPPLQPIQVTEQGSTIECGKYPIPS